MTSNTPTQLNNVPPVLNTTSGAGTGPRPGHPSPNLGSGAGLWVFQLEESTTHTILLVVPPMKLIGVKDVSVPVSPGHNNCILLITLGVVV